MTFADIASLAVAYSDLKMVESVLHAMNAGQNRTGPLGTTPAATANLIARPRPSVTPETKYNARVIRHPEPKTVAAASIERGNDRGVDRYEPSHEVAAIDSTVCIETDKRSKSPIQPVWATLPPVQHVTTDRVVKVVHQKVDLIGRGSLLDMFV